MPEGIPKVVWELRPGKVVIFDGLAIRSKHACTLVFTATDPAEIVCKEDVREGHLYLTLRNRSCQTKDTT